MRSSGKIVLSKQKRGKGSDVGKIVLLEKIIVHCETVIEIKRAILVSTL